MTEEEKMPQQGNKAAATDQTVISQPDKPEKQEGETALRQAEGNGKKLQPGFTRDSTHYHMSSLFSQYC